MNKTYQVYFCMRESSSVWISGLDHATARSYHVQAKEGLPFEVITTDGKSYIINPEYLVWSRMTKE
jgi:hypothetical protein